MNATLKSGFVRVASVVLGVAMLGALVTPVGAATVDDLLAQIAQLQSQLLALQGAGAPATSCNFTMNLSMGMSNSEVKMLQQFLNSKGAVVATAGAGSPGNETMYFGSLTKAAVVRWQNMNAASVLTPAGLTAGTGFWGAFSRAYANSLCTVSTGGGTTGGTTTPPPATGGISVAAGTQTI